MDLPQVHTVLVSVLLLQPWLRDRVLNHGKDENEHTPGKASAQDFQSKGPAIPQSMDDFPPKASKEETRARAEELNK